ncbi:MAG TPA: ergothioneine biosynthesis glutamate--cysteine ligase EgtA [Candidatus Nocardiopsis merdipullorum]|nr:ergothioneine biosynthesis glutamate--cysteine ligase EgtA [Candidatus Nocardiopsis merdipullorum]
MVHMNTEDIHEYINGICFKTGPPGKVGVEAEWLVADPTRPAEPVGIDHLSTLLEEVGPPPAGSKVTFEPGGQIELSSPPLLGPTRTHQALAADLDHLDKVLDEAGLVIVDSALDPLRAPARQLRTPRYTAMERFFTRNNHTSGRTMMCSTASIQVCLDIGADPTDRAERWELLHRIGPVLVAAFANSAVWRGRPTGWKSTRWAIWAGIDSGRTAPVLHPTGRRDPTESWADYALDAHVMAISETPGGGGTWTAAPGFTLSEWINGHGPRPITLADVDFHLSTLFPPVRPRSWWELRMIDAPPRRWWPVPVALATAAVDEPHARAVAEMATERLCGGSAPTRQLWLRAARDGLADTAIATCARACFDAAVEALPRMGAAALADLVDAYADQYTRRGKSPADTPRVPAPRPARTEGPALRHISTGGGAR